jgi:hypothetical protein
MSRVKNTRVNGNSSRLADISPDRLVLRSASRILAEGAVISTDNLIRANRAAIREDLNRQLEPAALERLRRERGGLHYWGVLLALPHYWRAMQPYAPHLRLMVDVEDQNGQHSLFVDVPATMVDRVVTYGQELVAGD